MAEAPILIIEDDSKIGRIIKAYLDGAGYSTIHRQTGKAALEIARKHTPLLAILDLMLPDMPGEAVFEELKELGDFPIIMVTAKSSEEERVAGFALGADDYVVKPFSTRELVWRVRSLLKRSHNRTLDEKTLLSFNSRMLTLDGRSYEATVGGNPVDLTPTEFKVLFTLASSPGKVFTRDELVERALGYQFEGYDRTVDAHIKNIRQKIENDPKNPGLILTIYGVGYRFSGKNDETSRN
ncbi:MAG: response regulator transcription factor [Syntrophales bacterium]|jgi:two-component system OmpR family response regulator|nr:response regulator transcription factor [Syntrophales bacterium]MDY0044479.1 response regulator transcription factor [Syntrophales bacterium]